MRDFDNVNSRFYSLTW